MKEIWKDIEGYEGLYQISNYGVVKSLKKYAGKSLRKEKILKTYKDKDGYIKVILCKNSKTRFLSIHRLLAEVFIPNPDNLPQINHKDENPLNNKVDNLEWCTQQHNVIHSKHKMYKQKNIIYSNINEKYIFKYGNRLENKEG